MKLLWIAKLFVHLIKTFHREIARVLLKFGLHDRGVGKDNITWGGGLKGKFMAEEATVMLNKS